MIFRSKLMDITRLLLCTALTLCVQPALAAPKDAPTTTKSLFEALPPNLGELQITPSRIPTNQKTLITVTLRIQYDYKPKTVVLRRLDNSAQHPIANLATFHDDGEQGDNIADDGVYTAQTNLSATHPTIIKLDALATFKNANEQQRITSLWSAVNAKTKVDTNQAYAVVDGTQVVFRDKHGRTLREESEQTSLEASKNFRSNAQIKKELVFKHQTTIISPDKSHVGIVGTLNSVDTTIPTTDEEQDNIAGWEFRYQNISGTLWTKTTKAEFYLPDTASLISENGDKVLLVETGEYGKHPSFTVYDWVGNVLLKENIALDSIQDAQISNSGHYLFFEGAPPTQNFDYVKLIVINLDNPTQRWTEIYRDAEITAKQTDNNAQGGFDIWLNNRKRYHFPK